MIYILTAKLDDGTIVVLTEAVSREQLRKWRRSTLFYCPQCSESVQLKVGDIVIPHFAHKKDKSCTTLFSEGESKEHLLGKQQLYSLFNRLGHSVKLEPYFSSLSQRPDLLVTTKTKKIPIEFQCSTIPIKLIDSRTSGYQKEGMNPIWLLHTPLKLKTLPQGVCKFQLSAYEKKFLKKFSLKGIVLLTYNPQMQQFHYFSSLLHIAGRRFIGIHRILPNSKQIFPFAQPKVPTDADLQNYVNLYLLARKRFLQNRILLNRRGVNDPFLRGCYELRILPSELPLTIGIPMASMNPFQEHPCEWQLAFTNYLHINQLSVDHITEDGLLDFVKAFRGPSDLQLQACRNYCYFLCSINMKSVNAFECFDEKEFSRKFSHEFLAK